MVFNFEDRHYELIKKEFGVEKAALEEMNEDELDDLYNDVCDIEIAEAPSGAEKISERGETAVEIVDIMAEALGYVQDDDWEEFLNEDDETPAPQPTPQRVVV